MTEGPSLSLAELTVLAVLRQRATTAATMTFLDDITPAGRGS